MSGDSAQPKSKQNIANILTMVRIRPLLQSQKDEQQSLEYIDDKTIQIRLSSGKRTEQVCKVFGHRSLQKQIFETIQPFISQCEKGYNVTVLTYGQTGSGKTYTMFGIDKNSITQVYKYNIDQIKQLTFIRNIQDDENHTGIIPRTINYIFTEILMKPKKYIKIYCSFIQLYNQNIMDLLECDKNKINKKLCIHQNANDGVYVQGIIQTEVTDAEQCLQLMQKGQRNRIVRQTHMNEKSSRSHTLFQLIMEEVFPTTKTYRRMKVNLCDLAGSQKINKIEKINQNHFDELKNINLSLSTLGKVISSLSQKYRKPPFRQSKLTRLLQDSLGGNTYTAIIAAITSKSSCIQQSLNTLNFLERAKQVKSLVQSKIYNTNPDMRNLQKQIVYLKDILKMKRNGIQIDVCMTDKVKKLQSQNKRLKEIVNQDLVEKLIKQNTHLKHELQRKTNQEILQNQSKFITIDNHDCSHTGKEKLSDKLSDVASNHSTNKALTKEKETRLNSTKAYTKKDDSRNTSKKNRHLFPTISPINKKNSSLILQRIMQIERRKKINKLNLQRQLQRIGQTQNNEKSINHSSPSKCQHCCQRKI